jgi:hypothetical protein
MVYSSRLEYKFGLDPDDLYQEGYKEALYLKLDCAEALLNILKEEEDEDFRDYKRIKAVNEAIQETKNLLDEIAAYR